MPSNQNNGEYKKVKSLRNRLARQNTSKKIGMHFWSSFLLWIMMTLVWFAAWEYYSLGDISMSSRSRSLTVGEIEISEDKAAVAKEIASNLTYVIADAISGEVLSALPAFEPIFILWALSSALFIINLLFCLLAYPAEIRRIKSVLKPIDELAFKVEELSRFEYSEEKYHLIEEKITSMTPDENEKLVLGDEDLQGIENAMNNLLMRIRASNRQQARFVNDASHELRTPIAVIEGYANMLARWGREDEKVLDESINAIVNESEHMKHLVEQLLFLARGDAGRTVVNPENVNINSLMREVYEESLMIDENHVYRFSCPSEAINVTADEGLIKQAVRILVDNAAKYTKEKDDIILSTGYKNKESGLVYLRVQDTGIGMKDADIEHMFERFYRSDEARSYGGTGLGLSIAKWIVDKHSGYFEITSREELGTRIDIILKIK